MDDPKKLAELIEAASDDEKLREFPLTFKNWEDQLSGTNVKPESIALAHHFKRRDYEFCHDKMFNIGAGSMRVNPLALAQWVIRRADAVGSLEAANDVLSYRTARSNASDYITVVCGLTVEKEFSLSKSTRLVPLESVPESREKESIQISGEKLGEWIAAGLPLGLVTATLMDKPTSALLTEVPISPKYNEPDDNEAPYRETEFPNHAAILVLATLACRNASPTPLQSWYQLRSYVPFAGMLGTLYQTHPDRVTPIKTEEQATDETIEILIELISKFETLNPSAQQLVLIAGSRLSQAINRREQVQKSIDLGIALESLFVTSTVREQVSYQFRTIGAILTGKSINERKENFEILQRVYDLRSEAVHRGSLAQTKNKLSGKGKVSNDEILDLGISLGRKGVTALIEQGGLTDQDRIELALGRDL